MVKYFCDVCGKEIKTHDKTKHYKILLTDKSPNYPRWEGIYDEVCKDCALYVRDIIDSLKENQTNG